MADSNEQDTNCSKQDQQTPATPAELASIQQKEEATLVDGIDLSTTARALVLYGEEIGITTKDMIALGYVFLLRAEMAIYAAIEEEQLRGSRADLKALAAWGCNSGGLMSLRLTLRAMLETPVDPGLWSHPS